MLDGTGGWEGALLAVTAAPAPGQCPQPDLRPGIALPGPPCLISETVRAGPAENP